jgi:hypothetical protein
MKKQNNEVRQKRGLLSQRPEQKPNDVAYVKLKQVPKPADYNPTHAHVPVPTSKPENSMQSSQGEASIPLGKRN